LFASFICGRLVLLSVKADGAAPPLVTAVPLGVLGLGLLAWALLVGKTTALALAARPFFFGTVELSLGVLAGAAFGLGWGLLFALTYAPCGAPGRHEYCLDFGPLYGLTSMLLVASIGGLALGMTLALVLGVCARVPLVEPEHG